MLWATNFILEILSKYVFFRPFYSLMKSIAIVFIFSKKKSWRRAL